MAKYIELVGVPGVGKTTTYNYLRKAYSHSEIAFGDEEINSNTVGKAVARRIKNLLKKTLYVRSSPVAETQHKDEFLESFINNNKELVNLFWESICSTKPVEKDLRFETVNYIIQILEKIQRVKEAGSAQIHIVDEGLIHNIKNFTVETSSQPYGEQIEKVLNIIDLPHGIVYFSGDINTIVERTLLRNKVIDQDRNLPEQALFNLRRKSMIEREKCIELIQEKRVPVLYLDAKENVESKAKKINLFVNDLL